MLDESFQMAQTQHKAVTAVLRFSKARKRKCVPTAGALADKKKKKTLKTKAITFTFKSAEGAAHWLWDSCHAESTNGSVCLC